MSLTPCSTLAQYAIPEPVLRTITTLKQHRYQAWLVGGSIRDILCGRVPKDFDITTDARPEQIRALFVRSRVVGKRFPVVHVRYKRQLMEISTLRRDSPARQRTSNPSGYITSDCHYGDDIRLDVLRRDYTMNALYYDPIKLQMHDQLGAHRDIQKRQIRSIGDPYTRFSEDPARMLRGLYFCAKLGFQIEPKLATTIKACADRITAISARRMNHDLNKMFGGGHSARVWTLLSEYGFIPYLFPSLAKALKNDHSGCVAKFIQHLFEQNDQRMTAYKHPNLSFIMAALLWYPLEMGISHRTERRRAQDTHGQRPDMSSRHIARILAMQQRVIALPRHKQFFMEDVWQIQPMLTNTQIQEHPKRALQLMRKQQFRSGLHLLRLRAHAEPALQPHVNQWNTIYDQAEISRPRRSAHKVGRSNRRTHGAYPSTQRFRK